MIFGEYPVVLFVAFFKPLAPSGEWKRSEFIQSNGVIEIPLKSSVVRFLL